MILSLIFTVAVSWAMFVEPASGACTQITRTNNAANAVLTSTKYNADLNTAYSAINSYDGGCIQSGTIEGPAVSDVPVLKDSVKTGCFLSYVDSNTINISKCGIAVGGNYLQTTSSASVTWTCSGCSPEASSSAYYVYIKNQTTFAPVISTTGPSDVEYNANGDRFIGRFYNNYAGDIVDTVTSFNGSSLYGQYIYGASYGGLPTAFCGAEISAAASVVKQTGNCILSVGHPSSGSFQVYMKRDYFESAPHCSMSTVDTEYKTRVQTGLWSINPYEDMVLFVIEGGNDATFDFNCFGKIK